MATALLACSNAPPRHPEVDANELVYVVRRSWHIDIGFAAADLRGPLSSVESEFPSATHLEFGFGDRRYLMAQHHGAGNLLAALWPGDGLVLMTALNGTPQAAFGAANVVAFPVTSQQSRQIQAFIWRTMSSDVIPIKPVATGPYDGSVFYAAIPRYSAIHTCNTWAAEALHAAGLPIRSTGVEFASQLWSQVQRAAPLAANDTGLSNHQSK